MQAGAIGGQMAGPAAQNAPQPRLVRAAHEFEGQMMKELLEPMTRSGSIPGGDDDDGNSSGPAGALGAFASEALGQAISAGGGFGIANTILRSLSRSGNQGETGKVTADLHANTVMRTSK